MTVDSVLLDNVRICSFASEACSLFFNVSTRTISDLPTEVYFYLQKIVYILLIFYFLYFTTV